MKLYNDYSSKETCHGSKIVHVDTNSVFYIEPARHRGEEYEFYVKLFKQSKIDIISNNYKQYLYMVGWVFVETDEWDEGSFNYMLDVLYLENYKKTIQGYYNKLAVANAKKRKWDFEATKRDFYSRYGKYLGSF